MFLLRCLVNSKTSFSVGTGAGNHFPRRQWALLLLLQTHARSPIFWKRWCILCVFPKNILLHYFTLKGFKCHLVFVSQLLRCAFSRVLWADAGQQDNFRSDHQHRATFVSVSRADHKLHIQSHKQPGEGFWDVWSASESKCDKTFLLRHIFVWISFNEGWCLMKSGAETLDWNI